MLDLDLTITQDDFTLRATLAIEAGARVAVIGPSGAGKSTLLAALAGLIPAQGRILWQGARIDTLPPAARPLSILFQDHNLFPHLSVFDNVALGVDPSLRRTAALRAQVGDVLEQVGLGDLAGRKPGQLSGGQISRAGLARALLRDKPVLLLDEPFAALGPALKADMLDLVAQMSGTRGITVLMVTHDPTDARRICSQTVLVADGRAHPPAPTGALLDDPPPALAAYLGRG